MRVRAPFNPVEGDQPYLFVSYARCDAAVVYAEIARLHEQGVRLWYDAAIKGGDDWEVVLFRKIRAPNCLGILAFVSLEFLASTECRGEIRTAERRRKSPIIPVVLEDHEPRLQTSAYDDDKRDHVQAFHERLLGLNMLEKYVLPQAEYHDRLDRSIPPACRSSGPVQPIAERELVVRYTLAVREPGEAAFGAVPADGVVARGSQFKALVMAEADCLAALLIETFDHQGRRTGLDIHAGRAGASIGQVLGTGVWDTLPAGGQLLFESDPQAVPRWRVGLVVWQPRRSPSIDSTLRSLRSDAILPRDQAALPPADNERRISTPLVTCKGFGLSDFAAAIALEGAGERGEMWHWTDVTFH